MNAAITVSYIERNQGLPGQTVAVIDGSACKLHMEGAH